MMSAQEYLALERPAETRSEFVNGNIYAMTSGNRAHNLITVGIGLKIHAHLRDRSCETYLTSMRILVQETGLYTYPDIVVVCDEPQFEDGYQDTLLNPTVIFEVLSPSTEAYDRGAKFSHYRRLDSLQEYLLVAQDRLSISHYVRDGGTWRFSEINEADASITLTSIGCTLLLREVYEKVRFPEGTPPR